MARLDQSRLDGRYVGVASIDSVGAWTDVSLADLASLTDEDIPESGVAIVSVELRETSGTNPAFLLLRANDGEAASAAEALETPASAARGLNCYLSNPVTTLSVYGQAQLSVFVI